MKVKMLTRYAGPGGTCSPGKAIDLPEKEAQSLIAGRYALLATGKIEPERDRGDRETEISNAVNMLLEENDASKLIASGAPSVEAVEALLGFDITSAERDLAYDKVG